MASSNRCYHPSSRGIGIKFFISTPDSPEVKVYRWMIPCQRDRLEWKKVIRKLHRITDSKYEEFQLSWNDGFHDCALMDSKDLRNAVEDMLGRCGEDSCVHIKVKALSKLNDAKPINHVPEASRIPEHPPPPYTEIQRQNNPGTPSESFNRSDSQRGNLKIVRCYPY